MMKLTKTLPWLSLTLLFSGIITSLPTKAENLSSTTIIAQNTDDKNSAIIQKKAETLIDLFFAQKFDDIIKSADPKLQPELSIDRFRQIWIDAQAENGNFQKLVKSQVVNTPGSDLVIVTLEFEKVTENWIVIFNDQQKIIGVDLPTSKNIETIAQEFVYSLAGGDFTNVRSYLHPFLKQEIFPEQIKQRWQNFIQQKGSFKSIISTKIRQGSAGDNTSIVLLDLEFGKSNETMLIIFDDKKRITGVDFVRN